MKLKRAFRACCAVLLVLGSFASTAYASDVIATWDNTVNNWTSAHWSSALFPNNGNGGLTYDAVVGGGSVTLDQDITIEKFTLTAGSLVGPTSFTLTLNDLFTWTDGTLTGVGNVTTSGGMILSGGNSKTLSGSRVLTNNGTATLSDGGTFQFVASGSAAPGVVVDNNGVFNATGEADFLFNNIGGGQPSFSNDGTFNKSGAGTTTSIQIAFNNTGTVNVDSGTLSLNGGGAHSGAFAVDALATLNFGGGTHPLDAASAVSGAGTVGFSGGVTTIAGSYNTGSTTISGGTVNFNSASATTGGGTFSSGTLSGSGSLTIDSGLFTWTDGTMTGTGTTTIAAPASLTLSGGNSKNLSGSRVLVNNGTTTLSDAGTFQFTATGTAAPGAIFDNNGVFNATSEADFLFNNLGGGQPSFSNDGTFNKSGAGTTTLIQITFNNAGTVNVDSGTLSIINALINLSAGTLTGGTYRSVDSGSGATFTSVGTAVSTIATDTTVELSGANSNMTFAGTNLAASLVNNAGTLRIYNGRTFTMTNALNNTGTFELGGASLADATLTSGGNIANSATGTIFGHGTINNTILNSGTVRAANGTLVINGGKIDGQSGTIQIDAGASLNLSSASGASDADFLVHNGAGLNLGSNDMLVGVDYTNANFGTGNAFNHRANVTGSGLILATPAVTQTLGGSVTNGGTALATMNFGNIHAGDMATLNYQINNIGGSGPNLRGAIQTSVNGGNLTDARLSGAGVTAGNFGPIAAGGSSGDLAVTFSATSAGAFVGQQVRIINNFDSVADQLLQFTGAAYRYANPTAHTPEPVNLGNFHVGDTAPSQALSITNNVPADGFSEALNATVGSPTADVTTNGGSFNLLAPGATNNTSLSVGLATATAGNKSGTATITLTSDGAGSSGLGQTPLASQTVNVTGSVFRLASASAHTPEPVNFGILHVGDPAPSQALSIANSAVNDGFSERLNATIGTPTGGVTTNSGTFSGLAPGSTNNTSLSVGVDTSTAGNKSGTATISLTSDGTGTSGLGTTPLASQTVNVAAQVNNFAVADVLKVAGAGALSMTGANEFLLNLGSIVQGQPALVAELGVENDAAAPSDSLAGSFTLAAPAFAFTGFGPFAGVAAGGTHDNLIVELNSSIAGMFSGQITLQPQSTNPTPFSMNLAPITINVIGSVGLGGDYNRNGTVDAADYVMWRNSVGDIVAAFSAADGDGSGTIDTGDYGVWQAHFGQTVDSGPAAGAGAFHAAVPEPNTILLVLLGIAEMQCRIKRLARRFP